MTIYGARYDPDRNPSVMIGSQKCRCYTGIGDPAFVKYIHK